MIQLFLLGFFPRCNAAWWVISFFWGGGVRCDLVAKSTTQFLNSNIRYKNFVHEAYREKSIANTRVDKDVLVFFVETLQVAQETRRFFLAENMGESSSPPPKKKKLMCLRCCPFHKVSFQTKRLENTHPPPPSSSVGPTVVPQKSLQVHQHWWLRWYLEFRLYLQDLWNFGPYPILGGKTFWRDFLVVYFYLDFKIIQGDAVKGFVSG